MNELVYRNLSEDAKRQICAWKYGGEYDLYNLPAYEEMQVRQIGFMNPQREKNYYGFWDKKHIGRICQYIGGKRRGIYWNRRKS